MDEVQHPIVREKAAGEVGLPLSWGPSNDRAISAAVMVAAMAMCSVQLAPLSPEWEVVEDETTPFRLACLMRVRQRATLRR